MPEESSLILVVDDNEMNRDMLSRRLKRLGYATMLANDGEKALEAIDENQFDLVLLDIMMPNLDGYETLERIKSNHLTRHIPVIMISAVDDLESVVRCIELGAEDYLFKPFNPVLLKARVAASLEKNRLRVSIEESADAMPQKIKELVDTIQENVIALNIELDNLNDSQKVKFDVLLDTTESLVDLLK